jgi:hypothetical protein
MPGDARIGDDRIDDTMLSLRRGKDRLNLVGARHVEVMEARASTGRDNFGRDRLAFFTQDVGYQYVRAEAPESVRGGTADADPGSGD